MSAHFDMDVTPLVEHGLALVLRHGSVKGLRIFNCERPHHAGITCICGWVDDPPMPEPIAAEDGE